MDKDKKLVIEQALKQLAHPVLKESKPARRLEKLLAGARESGKLSPDELHRATVDLVAEADISRSFAAKSDGTDDSHDGANNGLAIIFLLILLLLLLALADDGSDLKTLIQDLIDALLGRR